MILADMVDAADESPGSNAAGQRVTYALENRWRYPRCVRLGATLGATRMNNLRMLRTRLDNRERRARGHGLI